MTTNFMPHLATLNSEGTPTMCGYIHANNPYGPNVNTQFESMENFTQCREIPVCVIKGTKGKSRYICAKHRGEIARYEQYYFGEPEVEELNGD